MKLPIQDALLLLLCGYYYYSALVGRCACLDLKRKEGTGGSSSRTRCLSVFPSGQNTSSFFLGGGRIEGNFLVCKLTGTFWTRWSEVGAAVVKGYCTLREDTLCSHWLLLCCNVFFFFFLCREKPHSFPIGLTVTFPLFFFWKETPCFFFFMIGAFGIDAELDVDLDEERQIAGIYQVYTGIYMNIRTVFIHYYYTSVSSIFGPEIDACYDRGAPCFAV